MLIPVDLALETPPESPGAAAACPGEGRVDILRAAEAFYAAHNALLLGAGDVTAVARAEERLNDAIWGHFSPDPDFARKMKP